MRCTWVFGVTVLVQLAAAVPAAAQAIPSPTTSPTCRGKLRSRSVDGRKPPVQPLRRSTTPGYRDEAPRDGIDDARGQWLRSLAQRFAPWMVRNSVDFPMDFRRFVEAGDWSTLFIDAVDLSQAHPRLVGTETIEFSRLADGRARV